MGGASCSIWQPIDYQMSGWACLPVQSGRRSRSLTLTYETASVSPCLCGSFFSYYNQSIVNSSQFFSILSNLPPGFNQQSQFKPAPPDATYRYQTSIGRIISVFHRFNGTLKNRNAVLSLTLSNNYELVERNEDASEQHRVHSLALLVLYHKPGAVPTLHRATWRGLPGRQ